MARIRQYSYRRRSAFTLIELLLVVALISLLISILLPALKFSRLKSQQSVCQGNLRLLLEGYQSYARENGRRLVGANTSNPHDWIGGGNTVASITNGRLWNYVRSMESYRCPNQVYPWYLNSYSINGMLNGEQVNDGIASKRSWTTNMVPAKQMVFIEEDDYRGWNVNSFMLGGTNSFVDMVAANHDGGDNLGFLDGRVEFWYWQDSDLRIRPKHKPTPTFGFNDPGNADWAKLKAVFRSWPTNN